MQAGLFMDDKEIEVDVLRRIWHTPSGAYLEVAPDEDGPDAFIKLRTTTKDSVGYFGKIDVTFTKQFAKVLGEALIATAAELKG